MSKTSPAFLAMTLLAAAVLTGCASVSVDPAGYGSPPRQAAAESQIRNYFGSRLRDRDPKNLFCGPAAKAHHAQLSLGGGKLVWQGYAVPVSVDINASGGQRVSGRKYAALFSNGELTGVVDYPGRANAQGTMAFYWDGDSPARLAESPAPAQPIGELLPANQEPNPAPEAATDAPTTRPVPRGNPPESIPSPQAATWLPMTDAPALGTPLHLASDKSYVGTVIAYDPAHAFANGTTKPAVYVRYPGGMADWFTVSVAAQIYVVKGAK